MVVCSTVSRCDKTNPNECFISIYIFFINGTEIRVCWFCENRKHEVCSPVNFHAFSSCFYFYSFSFHRPLYTHVLYKIIFYTYFRRQSTIWPDFECSSYFILSGVREGDCAHFFSHNECISVSDFHTNRIHMCSMYGIYPPQV